MNNIYLVPGPTTVPAKIRAIYQHDFGSSDLDSDFFQLYSATEQLLQQLFGTTNSVVMMTGEAMLGLWGGLKSCLQPGDKVVSIANGVFGRGIGEMAQSLGAEVEFVEFPFYEAASDFERIDTVVKRVQPKMITAVHCETPSGILNPIAEIGAIKAKYNTPLLYVDAVASLGGAPVEVDNWHIDICLGGSQKVLSCPPDMTLLSVSPTAWETIQQVNYSGYDALGPYFNALKQQLFPYTPHWRGIAALTLATKMLLEEGLEQVFARHQQVATFCREKIAELGLTIYPHDKIYAAPTVTAINVPKNFTWNKLNNSLREHGLIVGGSFGPLAEKVFRIGHMGSQADMKLIKNALSILKLALAL
ncbi:MAG: alanine--glyoxylate aminotransferase family protein [Gammaproteobacteria bacterium]|nr:alanine--glyoxylate aminotransferase family protein [Gammaproteobacteria bacterium]